MLRRGRLTLSQSAGAKYALALALYAASRVIVGLGLHFGALLRQAPVEGAWTVESWLDPLLRFDAGWYASILRDGYHVAGAAGGESNLAFFPLYPLLAFAVKLVGAFDDWTSLLIVSNVFALACVLLLVKLGALLFGERDAVYAAAVFCFFPTSFFLNSAYAESVSIAFVLAGLLALERKKIALAALLAGAAAGARATGLALAPAVVYAAWTYGEAPWDRRLMRAAASGIVACGGLILFMVYQQAAFADPFAFVAAQRGWGQRALLDQVVRGVALLSLFPLRYSVVWFLAPLLILVCCRKRLGPELFLYGLSSLLIPYLTLGITPSMPRFVLMCAPLWFCLARWLRPNPVAASVYFSFSSALLCLDAARFSRWWFVA